MSDDNRCKFSDACARPAGHLGSCAATSRKVVQIDNCWVLCDDGTVWQHAGDGSWLPISLPPGCEPTP